MLSLTVVFGIVPTTQLADASAPFSDAVNAMSGGTWAGNLMAIAVIISRLWSAGRSSQSSRPPRRIGPGKPWRRARRSHDWHRTLAALAGCGNHPVPIRPLGREPGTHVYRDISKHPDDQQPPGIAVVRLDGDLSCHGRCPRGPHLRCRPLIERAPWDGARLPRHQRRRLSATGSSSKSSTSHPVSCASHHLSAARKAGKCGGHPTPRLVGNTIAS